MVRTDPEADLKGQGLEELLTWIGTFRQWGGTRSRCAPNAEKIECVKLDLVIQKGRGSVAELLTFRIQIVLTHFMNEADRIWTD